MPKLNAHFRLLLKIVLSSTWEWAEVDLSIGSPVEKTLVSGAPGEMIVELIRLNASKVIFYQIVLRNGTVHS
jgi:hypothetical protein